MLNTNVGSFTFSWELIINENLLRGLISRLYLDIVARVRQEREQSFEVICDRTEPFCYCLYVQQLK